MTTSSNGAGSGAQGPPTVLRSRTRRPAPRGLSRDRLLDPAVGPGAQPLVSVVAAAGCGKTTLLSHVAARETAPVAWLTLDGALSSATAVLAHLQLRVCGPDPGGGPDRPVEDDRRGPGRARTGARRAVAARPRRTPVDRRERGGRRRGRAAPPPAGTSACGPGLADRDVDRDDAAPRRDRDPAGRRGPEVPHVGGRGAVPDLPRHPAAGGRGGRSRAADRRLGRRASSSSTWRRAGARRPAAHGCWASGAASCRATTWRGTCSTRSRRRCGTSSSGPRCSPRSPRRAATSCSAARTPPRCSSGHTASGC